MVGKPEVIQKAGFWEALAVESHFRAGVGDCPKTLLPGWLQMADSTAVRFADISAHKQMFLGQRSST
jgi:hypothetical protein